MALSWCFTLRSVGDLGCVSLMRSLTDYLSYWAAWDWTFTNSDYLLIRLPYPPNITEFLFNKSAYIIILNSVLSTSLSRKPLTMRRRFLILTSTFSSMCFSTTLPLRGKASKPRDRTRLNCKGSQSQRMETSRGIWHLSCPKTTLTKSTETNSPCLTVARNSNLSLRMVRDLKTVVVNIGFRIRCRWNGFAAYGRTHKCWVQELTRLTLLGQARRNCGWPSGKVIEFQYPCERYDLRVDQNAKWRNVSSTRDQNSQLTECH